MKTAATSVRRTTRLAWFGTAAVVLSAATVAGVNTFGSTDKSAANVETSSIKGGSTGAGTLNGSKSKAEPPAKGFIITGEVSSQLFPDVERRLTLRVDNPNSQQIRVYQLELHVTGVTKNPSRAGTCAPESAVVGTWTGGPTKIGKNSPAVAVPGYIPLTLARSASDACQGATFSLSYTGKADQA